MNTLYEIKEFSIPSGLEDYPTVLVYTENRRGEYVAESSVKVVPPTLVYELDGSYQIAAPDDIIEEAIKSSVVFTKNYKPRTREFNEARLADTNVSNLYKALEFFPTLPRREDGSFHPLALATYTNFVYLEPSDTVSSVLAGEDFLKRGEIKARILDKVSDRVWDQFGCRLDLFDVPKHDVGSFCYTAGEDGITELAKLLSFGHPLAFPMDRLLREASSLKSAERFLAPQLKHYTVPESFKGYFTTLRVAIAWTEERMLDSGDLFPSGIIKVASKLSKKVQVKDIEQIPRSERNLVFKPMRSGIDIVHEELKEVDETKHTPGTIRLVFPGGVKLAAQVQEGRQLRSKNGEPVDLMIDFRTIADKGAVGLFGLMDPDNVGKGLTVEQCFEIFEGLEMEEVSVDGATYKAYVGHLPCARPGQRYIDLSKPSDEITVDMIAKASMREPYIVKARHEREYSQLVAFDLGIGKEIINVLNEATQNREIHK